VTHSDHPTHDRQRGMALITALLLLIVVTIMALSMFRSYGIQERIAGNTRDKQRAINAAVSAQQYAEYWLTSAAVPAAGVCTGVVPDTTGQICTNPLVVPTSLPWTSGVTYTHFTAGGGNGILNTVNATNATAGTYYAAPVFYITDLGPGAGGELYQINAVGYGGTANTVAVVESTYVVTSSTAKSDTGP
jgi:type IV pilus assembly protein PilX